MVCIKFSSDFDKKLWHIGMNDEIIAWIYMGISWPYMGISKFYVKEMLIVWTELTCLPLEYQIRNYTRYQYIRTVFIIYEKIIQCVLTFKCWLPIKNYDKTPSEHKSYASWQKPNWGKDFTTTENIIHKIKSSIN